MQVPLVYGIVHYRNRELTSSFLGGKRGDQGNWVETRIIKRDGNTFVAWPKVQEGYNIIIKQ